MRIFLLSILVAAWAWTLPAQQTRTATSAATATVIVGTSLYQNDFEKAEPGKVPEEFLVLEGAFGVKEEGGQKFLELAGAPLDTFGVLFGPTETNGLAISARIYGTGKGRRFPTFAVGLNGVGGYKLQVSPAKKSIELYKGEQVLASAPHVWDSDAWTVLRMQVRKVKDAEWTIEGKAWKEGALEPATWTVTATDKNEPIPGRASVWGAPYAGTAIRFDDLLVVKLAGQP